MSTFSCIVSAELFGRVYHAVSTEQSRYYLNGVFVTPHPDGEGALLVATDGHKMLVARDLAAIVNGSAIVSIDPAMLKACRARKALSPVLVVQGARAMVTERRGDEPADILEAFDLSRGDAVQMRDALIDGSFPDWRRAVPSSIADDGAVGRFNSDYLKVMGDALNTSTRREKTIRVVSAGGVNDPHWVFGANPSEQMFGVLMPMRDTHDSRIPLWLDKTPEASQAA